MGNISSASTNQDEANDINSSSPGHVSANGGEDLLQAEAATYGISRVYAPVVQTASNWASGGFLQISLPSSRWVQQSQSTTSNIDANSENQTGTRTSARAEIIGQRRRQIALLLSALARRRAISVHRSSDTSNRSESREASGNNTHNSSFTNRTREEATGHMELNEQQGTHNEGQINNSTGNESRTTQGSQNPDADRNSSNLSSRRVGSFILPHVIIRPQLPEDDFWSRIRAEMVNDPAHGATTREARRQETTQENARRPNFMRNFEGGNTTSSLETPNSSTSNAQNQLQEAQSSNQAPSENNSTSNAPLENRNNSRESNSQTSGLENLSRSNPGSNPSETGSPETNTEANPQDRPIIEIRRLPLHLYPPRLMGTMIAYLTQQFAQNQNTQTQQNPTENRSGIFTIFNAIDNARRDAVLRAEESQNLSTNNSEGTVQSDQPSVRSSQVFSTGEENQEGLPNSRLAAETISNLVSSLSEGEGQQGNPLNDLLGSGAYLRTPQGAPPSRDFQTVPSGEEEPRVETESTAEENANGDGQLRRGYFNIRRNISFLFRFLRSFETLLSATPPQRNSETPDASQESTSQPRETTEGLGEQEARTNSAPQMPRSEFPIVTNIYVPRSLNTPQEASSLAQGNRQQEPTIQRIGPSISISFGFPEAHTEGGVRPDEQRTRDPSESQQQPSQDETGEQPASDPAAQNTSTRELFAINFILSILVQMLRERVLLRAENRNLMSGVISINLRPARQRGATTGEESVQTTASAEASHPQNVNTIFATTPNAVQSDQPDQQQAQESNNLPNFAQLLNSLLPGSRTEAGSEQIEYIVFDASTGSVVNTNLDIEGRDPNDAGTDGVDDRVLNSISEFLLGEGLLSSSYEDLLHLGELIGPGRPTNVPLEDVDVNIPVLTWKRCDLYDSLEAEDTNESQDIEAGYEPAIEITDVKDEPSLMDVDEEVPSRNRVSEPKKIKLKDMLGSKEECAICLSSYEEGDLLRIIRCHHGFHKVCIDKWLISYVNSCPVCRNKAVNTTQSDQSVLRG